LLEPVMKIDRHLRSRHCTGPTWNANSHASIERVDARLVEVQVTVLTSPNIVAPGT
jgi:hypothetical protein